MSDHNRYGLERARSRLPSIVAEAHAGSRCIITRHGKPYAAVVPLADLDTPPGRGRGGILTLRGTGKGLWGRDSRETLAALRSEWSGSRRKR